MKQRSRSIRKRLHSFFLPHKRNGYKPHLFRAGSVAALLIAVVALEGGYLATTRIIFPSTDFLASVLPGSLVALTNNDRAANGVGTVTENTLLDQAATAAAEDMATKGYFAHVSPDGKSPWYWLDEVGYEYEYAGENLAVNFTDSEDVETAWMNSPTHRANIVKPEYTEIGIGVANGEYEGKDATFVVQFFAAPETRSTPTPASAPKVATAPAQTTAVTATSSALAVAQAPVEEAVLGAQLSPTPLPAPLALAATAATSPTHTLIWILSALAAVIGVLFVIAIIVKIRVQYLEVIAGGLILLVVLIGLICYDDWSASKVQIAPSDQTASGST